MNRLFTSAGVVTGTLILAGAGLAAVAPAAAAGQRETPAFQAGAPHSEAVAAYAAGPVTAGPLGEAGPASRIILHGITIPGAIPGGMLTTGLVLAASSDLTTYVRIASVLVQPEAPTWTDAGTTYTLRFSASQVSSWCRSGAWPDGTSGIVNGRGGSSPASVRGTASG